MPPEDPSMQCKKGTTILKFLQLTISLLIVVTGCRDTASRKQRTSTPIPNDVTYTIIGKDIVPGIKRSLDIRLSQRVSQEVLKTIGFKLKNSDSSTYDRTFICYYLPDMEINAGSWASTHFNPKLEVRIYGLTVGQYDLLNQRSENASRETLGSWLDERPFAGSRITIFRENGKLYMENKFKDGSVGVAELSQTYAHGRNRFDYEPDRGNGEYFLITGKGELQELDQDGPFMTAKKVK